MEKVAKVEFEGIDFVSESKDVCELLGCCGFFKKYEKTNEVTCKVYILIYCKGHKRDQCKRKEHRLKTGNPPDENMLPNGAYL